MITQGTGSYLQETPPRAWGRRLYVSRRGDGAGNTPTGVGKTPDDFHWPSDPQKHPHGRGEDYQDPIDDSLTVETPPRAWGRPNDGCEPRMGFGNTPTGVGKTHSRGLRASLAAKHPHGRGEDERAAHLDPVDGETPPRAWGRLPRMRPLPWSRRNTPTGVGKTPYTLGYRRGTWKHPHGRGED